MDVGNTSLGNDVRQINGLARGTLVTAPQNAGLVSITAHLEDSATGDTFEAAIYSSTGALIAESSPRTDISTAGWYTFTGFGTVNLVSATDYYIFAGSNSAANANHYFTAGGAGTAITTISGSITWPADAASEITGNADSRTYAIYYTDDDGGGSGSSNVFIGKLGLPLVGKL